jgi:hypothetical protein
MGIAVWASLGGRVTAASLAASAVDDDARQDECHARDPDHVRCMRRHEAVVCVVVDRADVDDDIQDAAHGHQREAEEHQERQLPEPFYHEHALEIHPEPTRVKSIEQNGM